MARVLRKSYENHKLNFQTLSFSLAKNQYYIISAFKLLKIEIKFDSTIATMKR